MLGNTSSDCSVFSRSSDAAIVFVKKAEVPFFLRSGQFYQSLSDEDEEQISVPSNTLKMDTKIESGSDLEHFLISQRFWGVNEISNEVIQYTLSEDGFESKILERFVSNFAYIKVLVDMLPLRDEHRLMVAARAGILEIVQHLPKDCLDDPIGALSAAEAGHLHILQYLHEHGANLSSYMLEGAIDGAKGLSCVEYMHKQGVDWPPGTLFIALVAGNKECFHYALANGCTWEDGGEDAFPRSDLHVEALKYALQHGYPRRANLMGIAAGCGAIQCLRAFHEANYPWDAGVCLQAATNGHLNCLQYLREHHCPWDGGTLLCAVQGGYLNCVQYAVTHGCTIPQISCYMAAKNGHATVLQCLHEAGAPWGGRDVCTAAAEGGHLDCLMYAHEHGAPWDHTACNGAAAHGHLPCLQYLHESGCTMIVDAYKQAVVAGHADCAKYIADHVMEGNDFLCTS